MDKMREALCVFNGRIMSIRLKDRFYSNAMWVGIQYIRQYTTKQNRRWV